MLTVMLCGPWTPKNLLTQNLLPNLVGESMLVPMWHSIQGVQPTGPKLDRHIQLIHNSACFVTT